MGRKKGALLWDHRQPVVHIIVYTLFTVYTLSQFIHMNIHNYLYIYIHINIYIIYIYIYIYIYIHIYIYIYTHMYIIYIYLHTIDCDASIYKLKYLINDRYSLYDIFKI